MAGETVILMDTFDNAYADSMTIGADSATCKLRGIMAAVTITPIIMAIKTTDGQGIILDNGLHTWIGRLQGAGVRGIGTAGVMAHGATATMKRINTGAGYPVIGELMAGRAANAMTGITECGAGKISSTLCHGVIGGGMRYIGMTIKVGRMAAYTLTTGWMRCRAAYAYSIGGAMTSSASQGAMCLTCSSVRSRGRDMATTGQAICANGGR